MPEYRTADPFVRFRVALPGGEQIAVWARTQQHAEAWAAKHVDGGPGSPSAMVAP